MYKAISKLGQASDKEKISAMKSYAKQAGTSYSEDEYEQILDEWTDATSEERRKKAALKTTMNKTAARTKSSLFLQNRR